ncbi:MAG: leucyl/phenylalanyl-tRNA--protein transferase [Candidatus Hydrogenedentota bacterium]
MPIYRLTEHLVFPPVTEAEDGLLAVGGDLDPRRLLLAYSEGIFPWYADDQPILWWSPDPRMVVRPEEVHVSRRLRRTMRQGTFRFTADTAFEQVVHACAEAPRPEQDGTWITQDMAAAYTELHRLGFAHSFEAWQGQQLAGGLYGVSLGGCFFGESMFSKVSDASKAAFVTAVRQFLRWGIRVIDCQVDNPHLRRLGAYEIPRARFLMLLRTHLKQETLAGAWHIDDDLRDGGEREDRNTPKHRQQGSAN